MNKKRTAYTKTIDHKFPVLVRLAMSEEIIKINTPSKKLVAIANLNLLDKDYFSGMNEAKIRVEVKKVAKSNVAVITNRLLLQDNVPENLKDEAALAITLLEHKKDKNYLLEEMNKIEFTSSDRENRKKVLNFLTMHLSTYVKR